jgi:hypothetical protein
VNIRIGRNSQSVAAGLEYRNGRVYVRQIGARLCELLFVTVD